MNVIARAYEREKRFQYTALTIWTKRNFSLNFVVVVARCIFLLAVSMHVYYQLFVAMLHTARPYRKVCILFADLRLGSVAMLPLSNKLI